VIIKLVELKNGSLRSKTSVIIESAFDQQILVSLVVRGNTFHEIALLIASQ
jgi:hypothetical protein